MRFTFIQSHARIFHISTMCRVLEVSRAGYYAWRARPLCDRVKDDRVLTAKIREIQRQVKSRYGSPRTHQELKALGFKCGENRVARVMRNAGIRAKSAPKFRVTTNSEHDHAIAPNVLDRQFSIEKNRQPDQTWVSDITYIPTREGWLYLSVIIDLSTRMVVGWSMRTRLDQELALNALRMALKHRSVRGGSPLVHHSDRGAQYAGGAYQLLLKEAGFTTSMSRPGDCWDNAVAESFFATLTKELLIDGVFESRQQGCRAVFEFIEVWYNRQRRHSSLGYRTPAEYEAELLKAS
jgi:transposase InsO family protein